MLRFMSRNRLHAALLVSTVIWLAGSGNLAAEVLSEPPRHFDILIRDGEIVDGTGAPPQRADVGINGDEIAAIGKSLRATADRVVDARGRVLTPGFIDLHSHVTDGAYGEAGLLSPDIRRRAAQNLVGQGITLALVNPDGDQSLPLAELRQRLEINGIGVNVAMLTGHNRLRTVAMNGQVGRAATESEIRTMLALLRDDLAKQGSFGMSLGLEYEPARHTALDEQISLARLLGEYNAVFSPHMRSQGIAPMWYLPSENKGQPPPTLGDSLAEAFQVAQDTGATVILTHMKAWGPGYRGQAKRLIDRIESVRSQGARLYMDVYPYDSSGSDGSFVALPGWVFPRGPQEGPVNYREALKSSLASMDAARRADLVADVRAQLALKGGAPNVRILEFPDASYVNKTYAELMKARRMDEVDLAIALQLEGHPNVRGGARMRSFSMLEKDIESFYQLNWCAVSTDGWIVLPEEAVGDLKYVDTNRRLFGSFPRRIAHFVLERKTDTLEHAVRSMTGLPAEILNLTDRGRLAVGLKADLVVLNLHSLQDNTTYLEPSVYPSGVDYVLVNGKFVVDAGNRTLRLPGRVLRPAGR